MISRPPPATREGEPPGAVVLVVIAGAIAGMLVGVIIGQPGETGLFEFQSFEILDDAITGSIVGGCVAWLLTSVAGEIRKSLRSRSR